MVIIHIGENKYVHKDDIIAILDRKAMDGTKISRSFISNIIKDNCLIGKLDSYVKSYILVENENKTIIYTSNISSKVLANRNN